MIVIDPMRRKWLGDGDGQRCAFLGISGGAQFVEQHQRLCRCSARDEVDVGDVGGECREILLDGLVVADVGQHGVEDGKLGAIGGNWHAGLSHQSQQADGFQSHCFAAGVWAGDDQFAAVAFEFDAYGNDVQTFSISDCVRAAGGGRCGG